MHEARGSCVVAAVWTAVFAAPHLYWLFGGRTGFGDAHPVAGPDLAARAFTTPTYNAVVLVMAVVAFTIALMVATRPPSDAVGGWLAVLVTAGVIVLVVRGVGGLVLLLVDVRRGEPWPPPVLTAVEPWLVLGAVVWSRVALTLARSFTRTRSPR